jgi:hypothetical protein
VLGPLLKIAARIVDHPLSRILLGLFGILVAALFGIYVVVLLLVNPLEHPASFALGLAACLGLLGWWTRLFLRSASLMHRPRLRLLVSFCLVAGVGAATYGLFFMPRGTSGFPMLTAMIAAGTLMLLGTLGASGPGPNNSFKPKPLRGSA